MGGAAHLLVAVLAGQAMGSAYLNGTTFPQSHTPRVNISLLRLGDLQPADVSEARSYRPEGWAGTSPPSLVDDASLRLSPLHDREGGSCGDTITDLQIGDSGYLRSPNYPSAYPADIKCVWWLKAAEKGRISMTCTDVRTQSCDSGYFDYILVAPDWGWEKYYLLCGDYNQYTPFTLASTENFLSIYFRSSLQHNYKGFVCRYEVKGDLASLPTTSPPLPTPSPSKVKYNGEEGCGKQFDSGRIVGGNEVLPAHHYPWMVGLSFNSQWFCGGTLLNREWVLTAAHCTHEATSSYAYLGAHNLYSEETGRLIIFTQEFHEHPHYDMDSIANDVSLVKLPRGSVTYSQHIRPACLPARFAEDAEVGHLVAVGWGKTDNAATISPVLNQLNVDLISNDGCRKSYGDIIRNTNLCAQGQEGTGTCQGDSGSSLQFLDAKEDRWIQFGIVSFGASTGCGTGHPNGYSRITEYLDFIGDTIGTIYE